MEGVEDGVGKEEEVGSGELEDDEPNDLELDGPPLRVAERVLVAVEVRVFDPLAVEVRVIDPLAVRVRVCDTDIDADTVDVEVCVASVGLGVADCDGVGASTQTRVRLQPEPTQLRQLLWPKNSGSV